MARLIVTTQMNLTLQKSFSGIFLLLLPSLVFGQLLTGKVLDEQNDPIPLAYVFFHKEDRHSHCDMFGAFEIEGVVNGDTIMVSHIGFSGKTVVVQDITKPLIIQLESQAIELGAVSISPKLDAINLFTQLDLGTTPVNSSQEMLRKVPGLIIGQHAGGGKAEQIFLRGFDIDHGTDINITVDGMPVNMVSHAHGQGYADMHFLIPETIEKIDFGKGPYYADQGNFATAGYASFRTKDRLDHSSVTMQYGQFNTIRTVGLFNVLDTDKQSAYIASDYQISDGPFESPQNFKRINLMGKYKYRTDNDDIISLQLSTFRSTWDASGQIPQRIVDNGTITRFGAVDSTEGGETGRTNVKLDYTKKLDAKSYIVNSIYFSQYDFELFSNFTFFLEDSINGDQIRQRENRQIFGASSEWNRTVSLNKTELNFKAGAGFRNDQIKNVGLSHTVNRRTTLFDIQLGNVDETNLYTYASVDIELGRWVINPAVRFDYFKFNYNDALAPNYLTLSADKGIVSPKLNILYNLSTNTQFYFKNGTGFHSNDTRVVVAREGNKILPAAYGNDLGVIWKPFSKLLINTAVWTLFLEQEFVYVGDAGIVEPSGRTQRSGIDFGARYQLHRSIYLYADVNYARPRSIDESSGNDRIPLAPEFTATGGIDIVDLKNFSGGIRFRHIQDRPANEDNSIVAEGYFITDVNVNYSMKRFTIGVAIENVLNSEWKEAQFATESRLRDEPASVEEIHFTPGTPFSAKGTITYKF